MEKYSDMHNIENYTLNYINEMVEVYKNYLKKNEGKDIKFPDVTLNMK